MLPFHVTKAEAEATGDKVAQPAHSRARWGHIPLTFPLMRTDPLSCSLRSHLPTRWPRSPFCGENGKMETLRHPVSVSAQEEGALRKLGKAQCGLPAGPWLSAFSGAQCLRWCVGWGESRCVFPALPCASELRQCSVRVESLPISLRRLRGPLESLGQQGHRRRAVSVP